MERLTELIREVTEITYGKNGALLRKRLYDTDRVRYRLLLTEGTLYERIREAERKGEDIG